MNIYKSKISYLPSILYQEDSEECIQLKQERDPIRYVVKGVFKMQLQRYFHNAVGQHVRNQQIQIEQVRKFLERVLQEDITDNA